MTPTLLTIAGRAFRSRLFLGTGKFGSPQVMRDALAASGCEIVTVALRRADLTSTAVQADTAPVNLWGEERLDWFWANLADRDNWMEALS